MWGGRIEEGMRPEFVVCSPPHLDPLCLWSIPEYCQVWLVPDVDYEFSGCTVCFEIGNQLIQVGIPELPVSIVS